MPGAVFLAFKALLEQSGAAFTIHEHAPARTMQDAERGLGFDVARIVKTVAFKTRDGRLVLAALRGARRVDYAALARTLGVGRRDVSALAPAEVLEKLGVEPGSVSPLALALDMHVGADALTLLDRDAAGIAPTLYCGLGRPDRTLELAPAELLRLSRARLADFSR